MAIKYLSGNRTYGTAAEIPTFGGVTGWTELGRATLGSAGDTLDLTGLDTSAYPHIKILATVQPSSGGSDETYINWRFNGDSGNNYAFRYNSDGGSDGSNTSQNKMLAYPPTNNQWQFSVMDLINKSDQEKLAILRTICRGATAGGASNSPNRREIVGKWANTSSTISQVTAVNSQTSQGNFEVGTEFVVLGANSSGGGATSAWQELDSVELSSSGSVITSNTFTAKKYLMIKLYHIDTGGYVNPKLQFNSDSGSNYASRYSDNGGSDSTTTSQSEVDLRAGEVQSPAITTIYVINKSDKEKLFISHSNMQNTAGAGNVPSRAEVVGKWTNTSAQITSVKFIKSASGSFNTGSYLKVWGMD